MSTKGFLHVKKAPVRLSFIKLRVPLCRYVCAIKKERERRATFLLLFVLHFLFLWEDLAWSFSLHYWRHKGDPLSRWLKFPQVGSCIFLSSCYYCHCHSTQDHMQAFIFLFYTFSLLRFSPFLSDDAFFPRRCCIKVTINGTSYYIQSDRYKK